MFRMYLKFKVLGLLQIKLISFDIYKDVMKYKSLLEKNIGWPWKINDIHTPLSTNVVQRILEPNFCVCPYTGNKYGYTILPFWLVIAY